MREEKEMKKMILITLMWVFLSFSIFAAGNGGKGTLHVKTQIIPVGTTKKYIRSPNLILDAGVLNSNSNISELPLASVTVRMYTEATNEGSGDYNGIEGDFNGVYKLGKFKELLDGQKIDLGNVTKYKNGKNARLELVAKNFRVNNMDVRDADNNSEYFTFIAYPEKATIGNEVVSFEYSFDLYLKVTGVEKGDIIRQDVITGTGSNATGEAVGRLKDIIKAQFTILQ